MGMGVAESGIWVREADVMSNFKYLGSFVLLDGSMVTELKQRIGDGWLACGEWEE